jgi:uncharacterized repeat protein (TIGR01451 family)
MSTDTKHLHRMGMAILLLCLTGFLFPVLAETHLSISKQAKKGADVITEAFPGDPFYYSIKFQVSSTSEPALNVTVTDTLPDNLIFIGTGGDVDHITDGGSYDPESHSVTWTVADPLPTGRMVEVFLDVKFPYGITCPGDQASNRSWADASNAIEPVKSGICTVTTKVMQPNLILRKDHRVECPVVGTGQQRYDIVIRVNNIPTWPFSPNRDAHFGILNLTGIKLIDTLPPGAVVDEVLTYPEIATVSGNTVTWDFGTYTVDDQTGKLIDWPYGWDQQRHKFCCFGNYQRTMSLIVSFPETHFEAGQTVTNHSEFIITRECLGDTVLTSSTQHELCEEGAGGWCQKEFNSQFHPDKFAIGQNASFQTNFRNDGNVYLDTLYWTDPIPPSMDVHQVYIPSMGGGTSAAAPIHLQYTTDVLSDTWIDIPGSPFSSTTGWVDMNVPTGEHVQVVRAFTEEPVAPNTLYRIYWRFVLLETGWDGTPVQVGDVVENCFHGAWRYGETVRAFECCDRFTVIEPGPPYCLVQKRALTEDFVAQGDIIDFILRVGIEYSAGTPESGQEPLINPEVVDLLPAGMEFVEWTRASATAGIPDPVFVERVPDYNGSGRELLRWKWPNTEFSGTVASYCNYQIKLKVRLTEKALNGTWRNDWYISDSDNEKIVLRTQQYNLGFYTVDEFDVNNNGDTSEKLIHNYDEVHVRGTTEYAGKKAARNLYTKDWKIHPEFSSIPEKDQVDFKLTITNTGQAPLDSIEIIDILPFVGDTEVTSSRSRGSEWAPRLVSVEASSNWTVYYSSQGNPDRPQFGVSGSAPGWSTSMGDPAFVKSIRLVGDLTENLIVPGESVALTIRMQSPENAPLQKMAWNSFAFRGHDGSSWAMATEPQKAGVMIVPGSVSKSNNSDQVQVNEEISYQISWTAPVDLDSAVVRDILPQCFTIESVSTGGKIVNAHTVEWTLESVTKGQTGTLSLTAIPGIDCPDESVQNCVTLYGIDRDKQRRQFYQHCDTDKLLTWGSIGDKVWYDHNADDKQDQAESGIPGVIVQLWQGETLVISDTTDGTGLYLFDQVEPGEYQVKIDPNSVPANHSYTGSTLPHAVSLGVDQEYLEADFGYKPDPGVVGDYCWFDLNGDGKQDGGDETGIAGCILYLLNAQEDTVARDTSSENGLYQFKEVQPGEYTVHIDPATVPENHTLTGGTNPHPFTIAAGGTYLDADFGYMPDPGFIGDYVWIDLDGEGDQDSEEKPKADVILYLLDAQGDTLACDTTDSQGAYGFEEVPTHRDGIAYQVIVDERSLKAHYILTGGTDPHDVSLTAGLVYREADFGYQPRGTIGDFVWFDSNGNGLPDAGEKGIGNTVLRLFDDQNNLIAKALTSPEGYYLFKNVPPGIYQVVIDPTNLPKEYKNTYGGSGYQIELSEFQIDLTADFAYTDNPVPGGKGEKHVLAWYEPWFAAAGRDSSLRHWSQDYLGGSTDSASFKNIIDDHLASCSLPARFDSRDPDIWEVHILLAWAAEIDAFVIDWHGRDSFEHEATMGLLDTAQRLYEEYGPLGFDFRIILAFNREAAYDAPSNLQFVADSILTHPAYWNTREQILSADATGYPRPLYIFDPDDQLEPYTFVSMARQILPQDTEIVWNTGPLSSSDWQEPYIALADRVDGYFAWISASDGQWDDNRGLEWGETYLNEFDALTDTLPLSHRVMSVWPGFDDRPWVLGQGHWMDRQDSSVFVETWTLPRDTAYEFALVQSWNDFNRATHVHPSELYGMETIDLTRRYGHDWKYSAETVFRVEPEGMDIPEHVLHAREMNVADENIEAALRAFFQRNYDQARQLLALPDEWQPNNGGNELVFHTGSKAHVKYPWTHVLDGDLEGWDGTALVSDDEETGTAWAIFGFGDGGIYKFNYVTLQTDPGTVDDGEEFKQVREIEIRVSTTGMAMSDFRTAGRIRCKGPQLYWYRLDDYVRAKYVMLIIHSPSNVGKWKHLVEFGVNSSDKKGALPASNEPEQIKAVTENRLDPNYPNPFNNETTISFELAKESHVRVEIYDIQGRLVQTLADGWHAGGPHRVVWQAHHQASGIYFVRLQAQGFSAVQKILLIE